MHDRIILHVDINNFYASAALLYNPELKDKSFVVCGDPDKRHGVVLAKNDAAKKSGVRTGETLADARRKVKDLYAVPPDFQKYTYLSQKAISIYKEYTPFVESFGLDECWLDVTETAHLFGGGYAIADDIRNRMKNEVGLTVSIGVSFTKVFAKLGSDMKKPDAITVISKDSYRDIVWNLSAEDMLYVGRSSGMKFREMGIKTIGDIATSDIVKLSFAFGKVGEKLFLMANGNDNDPVSESNQKYLPESVSNGTTTEVDIVTIKDAKTIIYSLSEVIAFRLRQYDCVVGGVSVSVRTADLEMESRQSRLSETTSDAKTIADEAISLLNSFYRFGVDRPIRMITVGTYALIERGEEEVQSTLFERPIKSDMINPKLDTLRKKYGYDILKRGIEINAVFRPDIKDVEDGYIPFDRNSAKKKD
ncbi:MAG: DNA polymerase IV [Clostridia bacterium]|nr:DNA polymerase IV [Clostridia bacterium]